MKTKHLKVTILLILLSLMTQSVLGQKKVDSWTEDFSDEVLLKKNWSKYDRKVPGTPKRFWKIEKGMIRGLAYKKIHPVGIMRDVSGKNMRLTCRVKLGKGAGIYIGFNGMNNGSNKVRPDQKHINFRRAGIHIFANQQISFFDEHYIHLSEEELKNKKLKTCEGNLVSQKFTFSTDVWHDLKIEMRENDMILWINGKEIKNYKMHSGNEAKRSFNFSVGHETKDPNLSIVSAWFDDMKLEIID